jgi:hypothetical protein
MISITPGFAQNSGTQSTAALQREWNGSTAKLGPSTRIGGGSVKRDKVGFYWETRIEPTTPTLGNGFTTIAVTDSTPVIHRVMLDRSGRTYFGYDVLVDTLPEANTFRITFRPLVMTERIAHGLDMDSWSAWVPLAAPRFPLPQTVHFGESLELTLLTNAATKQRIVDYVTIQEPTAKVPSFVSSDELDRNFSYATGSPRDITSTDVEMRIRSPRLTINGKADESTNSHADDVSGAFVWFHVPKHGRFVLSLGPHPELGFLKAGEVRGSSLVFAIGSDRYTLSAGAQIAPGQAAFNLYVLHQPNWRPTYPFADESAFSIGAVDRYEALDGK